MYTVRLIDQHRSISREVIERALKLLPIHLLGEWPTEEDWGWSYASNIAPGVNPHGIGYVRVEGIHANIVGVLETTIALQQILQHFGYKIEIFSIEFEMCNKSLYRWLGYDSSELSTIPKFINE